tara:strand:+ start:3588 stop:5045 length:1458 start_codon:yes stop_codon:yes gene_type:complete
MKIKYNILFFIIFNLIQTSYNINPENIAISNASAIAYNDFRSYNPASISYHEGLSVKLFGFNIGFENNFLSVSKYNDINGANFEETTDPNYFDKSELYKIFDDGLKINTHLALNLPLTELIYKNYSFHNRVFFINESQLPQSFVKLLLYGNEPNEIYNLNSSIKVNIFSESGIGYAKKINNLSLGIKIKYLQGIAYGDLVNLNDNSSFFVTDTTTGFMGEAKYLINQAIGGSGFGVDIGFIFDYSKKMKFGISLNNLFGKINWDENNITFNYFRDEVNSNFDLRYNEKQFFSIKLDTLNAFKIINSPLNEIYTVENFPVIQFDNLDEIPFNIDSLLYINSLIEINDEFYLLKSQNLTNNQIKSLNLESQSYETQYPTIINFSLKRELEENINLCIGLESSFSNNLRNSELWKLSSGIIFNRFKNHPITIGFSIQEKGKIYSGFSYGYRLGPLLLNYGLSFNDAIFFQSTKGIDLSFSVSFKTNKI